MALKPSFVRRGAEAIPYDDARRSPRGESVLNSLHHATARYYAEEMGLRWRQHQSVIPFFCNCL